MIAALPMYDWPETETQNNLLWASMAKKLRDAGISVPEKLTRGHDLAALWLSSDLLIAQTCSYPLETILKDKVQYVATPSYAVDGCETPGNYRSVILMRGTKENVPVPKEHQVVLPNWLSNACFAINSLDSMSGYHALKRDAETVNQSLPLRHIKTGSHRASIISVAEGASDFCTVDCVSWAMALEYEPAAKHVHIAGWTKQRPGLPLITSSETNETVLAALVAAAKTFLGAVILRKPTDF